MPIDLSAIKAKAREQLRTAVPRPYTVGLLYVLTAGALVVLSSLILSGNITQEAWEKYLSLVAAQRMDEAIRFASTLTPSTADSLISLVLQLFRGIVAAGLSIYALNVLRGKEASPWNLLDGFARFFPLLLLTALSQILVGLWSYLFLIPGIIAIYRYRLAVYLMLDYPNLNALHCILLSGRMMRGHKWRLFLLDLSFFGWWLLAALPLLMLSALPGWLPLILGGLGSALIFAWLLPYYELSCVGFYEAVKLPVQFEPPDGPRE